MGMNIVFTVLIAVSTVLLLIVDPSLVLPALTDSSVKAVELTLKLLSIYAVWMGVLKICDASGVSKKLSHALRPVIRFLFGDVSESTMEFLSVNMSANILGMGNAATPAAMNAIRSMDEGKTVASYAMVMLVVLNATSLQVLPTSIISLRQSYGSAAASDIILPSFIASTIATALGVALVMLLCRRKRKEDADEHALSPKKLLAGPARGGVAEHKSRAIRGRAANKSLPAKPLAERSK